MLAFNTFQTPLYGTLIAVGTLISEGEVNWEKVGGGMAKGAAFSPLIGTTLAWYCDAFRRFFGVKTALEKAEE